MMIKKYYSISEAQQILAIPSHKLRYFEKATRKLNIFKIKGRRYYTIGDLEFLKKYFSKLKPQISAEDKILSTKFFSNEIMEDQQIFCSNKLERIEVLICKLKNLSSTIKSSPI